MSGVIFIVVVPSEKYEISRKRLSKEKFLLKNQFHLNIEQLKTAVNLDEKGSSFDKKEKNKKYHLVRSKSLEKLPKIYNEHRRESTVSFKDEESIELSTEKALKTILNKLKIEHISWTKCYDDTHWQVIFPSKSGSQCEDILEALKENKIGRTVGSTVCVIPCDLFYHSGMDAEKSYEEFNLSNIDIKHQGKEKDTGWSRFLASVRARLTVAQLAEGIKTDALLTFDFVCLLIIATVLCAIGLVENSNVYLLSSMLISPMMGPVMAATFGTVIRDRRLQKIGVNNALIGLCIATFVGFCYGTIICLFCEKYGDNEWPTPEMISRGEIRTLRVECLIALLSGAAVALGILGDNVASLVGVAISTSLMPPAVNAGLLWSLASIYSVTGNGTTSLPITNNNYYSTNPVVELAALGGMSICLTFINIVCIYFAGILVFKIKEVAPMTSKDHAKRRFWKHDIKIARDYNRTVQNEDAKALYEQFQKELNYQGIQEQSHDPNYNINNRHHSSDYVRERQNLNFGDAQYTWSPCTFEQQFKRSTAQELHYLFNHLIEKQYTMVGSRKQSRAWPLQAQLFEEPNFVSHSENELVIDIPENDNGSESPLIPIKSSEDDTSNNCFSKPKRFTVTPSASDPLKQQNNVS